MSCEAKGKLDRYHPHDASTKTTPYRLEWFALIILISNGDRNHDLGMMMRLPRVLRNMHPEGMVLLELFKLKGLQSKYRVRETVGV